MFSRC